MSQEEICASLDESFTTLKESRAYLEEKPSYVSVQEIHLMPELFSSEDSDDM
jgi:hypothetical protein